MHTLDAAGRRDEQLSAFGAFITKLSEAASTCTAMLLQMLSASLDAEETVATFHVQQGVKE